MTRARFTLVVGTAYADCDSECDAAQASVAVACGTDALDSSSCSSGCQDAVDVVYSTCDCHEEWEASKPGVKALAEGMGCAGASSAAPALFVGIAAIVGHFFN